MVGHVTAGYLLMGKVLLGRRFSHWYPCVTTTITWSYTKKTKEIMIDFRKQSCDTQRRWNRGWRTDTTAIHVNPQTDQTPPGGPHKLPKCTIKSDLAHDYTVRFSSCTAEERKDLQHIIKTDNHQRPSSESGGHLLQSSSEESWKHQGRLHTSPGRCLCDLHAG